MANALAQETSPYLRQHAENPVDWLPWGPDAFARARERDRPLLVSIGYSACHWCHVMERESFEDPATARVMNESFVCVKVDREERPDVDAIYMDAVQGMTGQGGWPLNVFLTPEQLPFYGGTYFPPEPRHGMPAWTQVLNAIAESWEQHRGEIRAGGERVRERLSGAARLTPSERPLSEAPLEQAVGTLARSFDARHGGFGTAPKFPQAPVLEFLLARGERAMALASLHAMADGGIHDQIGGGFARYSVDAAWTVPHFEKMLYDNALLARAYLHGWQASRDERLLEVCRDTLDWALREMRGPEGGFHSALDADSEGVEGRFYVWTVAQLREVLGEDADAALAWLGATEHGNFSDPHDPDARREAPGSNVLQARGPDPGAQVRERVRARLLAARERRVRPGLDDKRLTSWNALMIGALAETGAALGEDGARYLDAAIACAEFVQRELRDGRGRLLRSYNHGHAKLDAYLEDHAYLLEALIVLFEATCEERWLAQAVTLAGETIERFADAEHGGFFSTAADAEALIARRKDLEDSPTPSGSSSAALGLLRLAQLTGNAEYERRALGAIALVAEIAPRHPSSFGHMLQALHWQLAPARPVACAVPPGYAAG
ncbi:MAG TPA: thioredoxin domain-containing protein [Solirubrobacteraceae bacterium]|nr:thioredoxin domain-containing protein [Solirubrobacteraceae bacterium]